MNDRRPDSGPRAQGPGAQGPGAQGPGALGHDPRGRAPQSVEARPVLSEVALADILARVRTELPPPAPPPFSTVTARIDAEIASPVRLFTRLAELPPMRRFAVAAALVVALGAAVVFRGGPRSDPASARATGSIPLAMGPHVRLVRIGGQGLTTLGPLLLAQRGDVLLADAASSVRLDDRTTITLEPRARLRLGTRDEVAVLDGRATFDVAHDETRPFSVETSTLRVVDLGTRFAVEVSAEAAGERVLVSVEQGRVRVEPGLTAAGRETGVGRDAARRDGRAAEVGRDGIAAAATVLELIEGQGLAFVSGRPTGTPYALSARPTLSLEADDVTASPDRAVTVRLVFHNPTDGWLALPVFDPVRAPLHVEVTAPDGSVQAVRVSEAMLIDGGSSGSSLPPRGHLSMRVRFEHTFASPGTYRLRAIYRPAGAVDEGASPELVLPVR